MRETGGSILEFGAGTGALARDILKQLEIEDSIPEQYFIIEISADLKQRQQQLLQQDIPHLFDKICWLDQMPKEGFKGVILANEVLDAMPVHLFELNDSGPSEVHVALDENEDFIFENKQILSPALKQWFEREEIKAIFDQGEFNEQQCNQYRSEVNLAMEGWIQSLARCLEQGLIILIDYGYPRHEYYLSQRNQGTLICHYRHHSHNEALLLAGLQDITAHVDFTAVAECAFDAGLSVSGYTNQASFLSGCGILELAEKATEGNAETQMKIAQHIRKLIMPEEMGELFKTIALSKDLSAELSMNLIGFSFSDLRRAL